MSILEFDILLMGMFTKSQVSVRASHKRAIYSEELKSHIREAWQQVLRKQTGGWTGKLSRLSDFEVKDKILQLILEDTDYREYVGTRTKEIFQKYGPRCMANPLAICSVISTIDKKILICRRSKSVESRADCFHVVGGYLNPRKHCDENGLPSPFVAMTTEILEETGINENYLEYMICLGLVYDLSLYHPELVFYTESSLQSSEIRKNWESQELIFVDNDPETIVNFIAQHCSEFVPTGLANIIFYVKYRYGKVWSEALLSDIPHGKEIFRKMSNTRWDLKQNSIEKYILGVH